MPSLRPAKIAGLMVLVLLVGSNLVLPAGAHVTSNLTHLQGHLDPRYINANEMAANSNLLDGQDSSAFLGANAKAADANLLDGQDSTAFVSGPGRVVGNAVAAPPFSIRAPLVILNHFWISYHCPSDLGQGAFEFKNLSNGTENVFYDNGGSNPTYHQVAANGTLFLPTAATGEFYTLQVHSPTQGIATIHVMSVHRASDCHVQAQAVISN